VLAYLLLQAYQQYVIVFVSFVCLFVFVSLVLVSIVTKPVRPRRAVRLFVSTINLLPLVVLFVGLADNANVKVFHMYANFAGTIVALILRDVDVLRALALYWLLFVAYFASLTTFANASAIRANFFLGNFQAGKSESFLRERGITHVLEFFDSPRRRNPVLSESTRIVHKQMFLEDRSHARLADVESEAFAFIDAALAQQRGKVLVHCTMGVSRSASVVMLYLMRRETLTYRTAYEQVYSKRPCIDPNASFRYHFFLGGQFVALCRSVLFYFRKQLQDACPTYK
jgi:protein-tyrosine phosphatase